MHQKSPPLNQRGRSSSPTHTDQDLGCATVAYVINSGGFSGDPGTELLLATGLCADKDGVAAGMVVVELTTHGFAFLKGPRNRIKKGKRREAEGRGRGWN